MYFMHRLLKMVCYIFGNLLDNEVPSPAFKTFPTIFSLLLAVIRTTVAAGPRGLPIPYPPNLPSDAS
jgi:hypothetical protein